MPGPFLVRDDSEPMVEAVRERMDALFREHYAGLCGFVARYMDSREVAEEVVQELFLKLWELMEAGETPALTKAYLYSAARNHALNLLRHERIVRRHAKHVSAAQRLEPHPTTSAIVAELEHDELARAVRQAVAELPERCRLVFMLSRDRGLTYGEISQVLDISVKAVEGNMGRALKSLRSALGDFLVPGLATLMPAARQLLDR